MGYNVTVRNESMMKNVVSFTETTETIYSHHSMEIYKSIVCFEVVTGVW